MICSHALHELSSWPLLFLLLAALCLAGAGRSVFSITDGFADSWYQILDDGAFTGAGGDTATVLEVQICQPQTFPPTSDHKKNCGSEEFLPDDQFGFRISSGSRMCCGTGVLNRN